MTELLQSAPEAHVWQLLLPVLARAVETRGGPVALIGAPHEPFGPVARGRRAAGRSLAVDSQRSVSRAACGPASRRCAAPTWRPCWPGCRRRAWASCGGCSSRRRSTRGCCSCSGPRRWRTSASPARLRLQLQSAEAGAMDGPHPQAPRPAAGGAPPAAGAQRAHGGAAGGQPVAAQAAPAAGGRSQPLRRRRARRIDEARKKEASHVLDRTAVAA